MSIADVLRRAGRLVRLAYGEWSKDHAGQYGAALAYYTFFSLAPLLVLAIALAGVFFGADAAEGRIVSELQHFLGRDGAEAIQALVRRARGSDAGLPASVAGIGVLLLGATPISIYNSSAAEQIQYLAGHCGASVGIVEDVFLDRFQEALAPLRLAHQHGPARGTGHRLGYCYLALGDFGSAVQVLEREVRQFPDLINARTALGVALVQLSRREEALPVFLEAARLDPGSAEAHTNAGNLLAELGRHDEALAYLRQAVRARPGLADLHFNLGVALQRLKRHEEAIDSFQAALDIAPRLPNALGYRVWSELALCRWGALAGGIDALRRAARAQQPAHAVAAAVARRALSPRAHPRRVPVGGLPRACDRLPRGGAVRAPRSLRFRDRRRLLRPGRRQPDARAAGARLRSVRRRARAVR